MIKLIKTTGEPIINEIIKIAENIGFEYLGLLNSENRPYIYLYLLDKNVIIKNDLGSRKELGDIINKIKISKYDNSYNISDDVSMVRKELDESFILHNYIHSHIPSQTFTRYITEPSFIYYCTGNTFLDMSYEITKEEDLYRAAIFFKKLKNINSYESIDGTPYLYMTTIESKVKQSLLNEKSIRRIFIRNINSDNIVIKRDSILLYNDRELNILFENGKKEVYLMDNYYNHISVNLNSLKKGTPILKDYKSNIHKVKIKDDIKFLTKRKTLELLKKEMTKIFKHYKYVYYETIKEQK